MAGCNKPLGHDKPLLKYRWNPVQASPDVASFVRQDYPLTVSDSKDKPCSKKPECKAPEVVSMAHLISAVSKIWDCASRPLAFFQSETDLECKDPSSQEEVGLGTLGGEGHVKVPTSATSNYFSVGLKTAGQFSPQQPYLDLLKVYQKISVFESCSQNYTHSSFWRLIHRDENEPRESWRGRGIASVEISYELESMYGWFKQMIPACSRYPLKVTEIKNRNKEYCMSVDTISLAGECITGNKPYPTNSLTTVSVDYNVIKPYNSSSFVAAELESKMRPSLKSGYFPRVVQDIKADSSIRTLYTDSYINLLESHGGAFEYSWHIADDNEGLDNKTKEPVEFVTEDDCRKNICSTACRKPQSTLARQEHAVAGALAGIFVSLCLHPVDTVKTVIQSCHAEQKSVCYIGKTIISDRGKLLCNGYHAL